MKIRLITILLIVLSVMLLCGCNETDDIHNHNDVSASDSSNTTYSEVPSESVVLSTDEGVNTETDTDSSPSQVIDSVPKGESTTETETNAVSEIPDTTDSTQKNTGEPEINFSDLV